MIIKQYKYAVLFAIILAILLVIWPEAGQKAARISLEDTLLILGILPPILILVGLMEVWLPREVVIRYMGEESGIKGIALAFLLGSVAAGPLFISFPIAAMLAKKGARLGNILFFIGVWSSAKLPLVLFEVSFFGVRFTAIHLSVALIIFLSGSYIIEKLMPGEGLDNLKKMALPDEKK